MIGAWIGCLQFALGKSECLEAFTKETGFDIVKVLKVTPLEAMIDQATGFDKKVITAWADWVTENVWGEEK